MTRVALVGAGGMASEHAKAFRDVPGVELAGVYGRTRERAAAMAEKHSIPFVGDSIAQLYERTQAELVVVAVSELSTRNVAEECFRFGWSCLLEKPAGYNVPDAEAIAASARAQGRKAFVALNRRHYSSTRAVFDDLGIGSERRFIHVQDQEDPRPALAAGRPREVVENWMYANSIHLIDYFAVLARGSVTSVDPVIRWNPAAPDIVVAKIAFSSGDVGLYQALWHRPGPWAVSVSTASKRWEMRPVEQAAYQRAGERKVEQVENHVWDTQFKPGFRRQAELAVRAARGERVPELPTLDDALASMRLTSAIYAAD